MKAIIKYMELKASKQRGGTIAAISMVIVMALCQAGSMTSAVADEDESAVSSEAGLVARWTFNDDCYGYDSMVGDPEFLDESPVDGTRAVRFDGDSALILGDSKELKPEKLTLSFWTRRTGSVTEGEWGILIDASTGAERYGEGWGLGKWGAVENLFVLDGEDRLRWDYEPGLDDFYSTDWTHLAFTFDADRELFQIFKDGEEVANYNNMHGFWRGSWDSASITAHETPVSLGALSDGSEGLPLDFSDVRIYNRVLESYEIVQLITGIDFSEAEPQVLLDILQDPAEADGIRLTAMAVLKETGLQQEDLASVLLGILESSEETDELRLEGFDVLAELEVSNEQMTSVLLDIVKETEETDALRLRALSFLNVIEVPAEKAAPVLLDIVRDVDETDDVRLKAAGGIRGSGAGVAEETLPVFVVSWGGDVFGQATVPEGLANIKSVATGTFHSLALNEDGTVAAWGWNNNEQAEVPGGLSNVVAVDAGGAHNIALKDDGGVVAWGFDNFGQSTVPGNMDEVQAIAAGGSHSLALKKDSTVVAWGADDNGQSTVPDGLSDVTSIAAGSSHSLALKEDGTVVAWGLDNRGQSTVPDDLEGVKAISAGSSHNLALQEDGTVVAWGDDWAGQSTVPGGLNDVKTIAAGGSQSVVVEGDGTVRAWGADADAIPAGLGNVKVESIAPGRHCLVLVRVVL